MGCTWSTKWSHQNYQGRPILVVALYSINNNKEEALRKEQVFLSLIIVVSILVDFSQNMSRDVTTNEKRCSLTRKAVFPAISTAVSPALANLLTQPVREAIRTFFTLCLLSRIFFKWKSIKATGSVKGIILKMYFGIKKKRFAERKLKYEHIDT